MADEGRRRRAGCVLAMTCDLVAEEGRARMREGVIVGGPEESGVTIQVRYN